MFSQASVCPEGDLPSGKRPPWRETPLWKETPQTETPLDRDPLEVTWDQTGSDIIEPLQKEHWTSKGSLSRVSLSGGSPSRGGLSPGGSLSRGEIPLWTYRTLQWRCRWKVSLRGVVVKNKHLLKCS